MIKKLKIESYEFLYFKNAYWVKIFHQNAVDISSQFISKEEVFSSNQTNKFSILSEAKEMKHYGDNYEFLLQYPEKRGEFNRWVQKNFPTEEMEIEVIRDRYNYLYDKCPHCNSELKIKKNSVNYNYNKDI